MAGNLTCVEYFSCRGCGGCKIPHRAPLILSGRRQSLQTGPLRLQQPQRNGTKGHQPTMLLLSDAHQLADQGLAHKDQLALPLDLPIRPYPSHLSPGRVLGLLDSWGIRAWRRHIQGDRRHLAQGLMRSQGIIDPTEGVISLLLGRGIGGGRPHGLLFEGAVQPFMPAVLLRMAWVDAFGQDAQLDPPHRQGGQTSSTHRGKGRPIVGADGLGSA